MPKTPHELRVQLVTELLNNSTKYKVDIDKVTRKQLKLMLCNSQLPSLELLLPVSKMFKVRVLVYFWSEQPVVYQYDSYQSDIHLHCLGGVHFNPLVPMQDYSTPDVKVCIVNDCQSPDVVDEVQVSSSNYYFDTDDELVLNLVNENSTSLHCNHLSNFVMQPQVSAQVGNYKFCAVLDTGAEISLVSESVLIMLNIQTIVTADRLVCNIVGLGGATVPISKVAMLQFNFNDYQMPCKHEFAIVPDYVFPHCLLLGLDFILAFSVSIDFQRNACLRDNFSVEFASCNSSNVSNNVMLAEVVGANFPCVSHEVRIDVDDCDTRIQLIGTDRTITGLSLLLSHDQIKLLQSKSSELTQLKRYLSNCVSPKKWSGCKPFARYLDRLFIEDDILFYRESKSLIVVSFSILVDLSVMLHNNFSHVGREKLLDLLSTIVWHPKRYMVASDISSTCPDCQVSKISAKVVFPPTLKICSSYPFELVAADLVSFPKSLHNFSCLLTVVDHFSKWVAAVPLRDKSSKSVINALECQILPFIPKVPTKLLTDNGPEFTSSSFEGFLCSFNIKHQLTTPYRPSSNGAIERVNRTIQGFIRSLTSEKYNWDLNVPKAVITYNNTLHTELGMSPAQFLMTRQHSSDFVPLIDVPTLETRWRLSHPKFHSFKIGQFVLKRIPMKGNLNSNKLSSKYNGPFKVIKVNGNEVTYQLLDLQTGDVIRAHHSDLHYFKRPPNYLRNHPWFPNALIETDHNLSRPDTVPDISFPLASDSSSTADDSLPSEESSEDIDVIGNCDGGNWFQDSVMFKNGKCLGCEYEHFIENLTACSNSVAGVSVDGSGRHSVHTTMGDGNDRPVIMLDDMCDTWEVSAASVDTFRAGTCVSGINENNLSGSNSETGQICPGEVVDAESICSNSSESISALESFIDSSFQGFVMNPVANDKYEKLKNILSHDKNVNPPINKEAKETDPLRRHTRSQGSVPNLPNVQQKILERRIFQ